MTPTIRKKKKTKQQNYRSGTNKQTMSPARLIFTILEVHVSCLVTPPPASLFDIIQPWRRQTNFNFWPIFCYNLALAQTDKLQVLAYQTINARIARMQESNEID
jgi:hypothetical protein